jgi:hypothetical protein
MRIQTSDKWIRIREGGSGSGRVDLDPDTDRNESTNVPISKLRIETKPKRFDVFQNLKWNVSVYSKKFGTKPKLFDVFQLVRHVTGNDKDYLRKIPRVVV